MTDILTSNGKTSSMRGAMFLCVLTSCYMAIAALHLDRDLFEVAPLVVILLGAGIGGKVAQHKTEK